MKAETRKMLNAAWNQKQNERQNILALQKAGRNANKTGTRKTVFKMPILTANSHLLFLRIGKRDAYFAGKYWAELKVAIEQGTETLEIFEARWSGITVKGYQLMADAGKLCHLYRDPIIKITED